MKYILSLAFAFFLINSTKAQINSFPYTEDFESQNTCGTACAGPCNLSGGWENGQNNTQDWLVDQGGTTSSNTGPSQDHNPGSTSGNYLYTETSGCTNGTANLLSPNFDFSLLSNPTVGFWYHMFGAAMGDMHFDIDTGTGWINDIIPSWTDNIDQWQYREVNLTNWAALNPNVRFRVRGETGTTFTSDMAVDNFRVFNDIPDDLGITDIISPVQGCGLSGTVPLEVEITNLGASDQSGFSVAYQINNNTPVIEAFGAQLNSDNKANFTFSNDINLNVQEDLSLKVWVVFPQDLNNLNDTMSMGLIEVMPLELVNFQNYNGNNIQNAVPGWYEANGNSASNQGNSDWTVSDSLQQIALGVPTARVNMQGTQVSEWIVSQPLKITNSSRLFYYVAVTQKDQTGSATMGSDDKLELFVSTDCGNTYTSVQIIDAGSGLNNNLRQFALNLSPYIGQEIIFAWKAQSGPTNDPADYDLHLTLIEARRVFPNDVGIIDFRTSDGDKQIEANSGENIFITLKNFGSNTVSNIPIISKVGNVNFQDVYYNNIGSNAEIEINIGAYFGDPNGSQNIPILSYTIYNGDTINSNDTLNQTLFVPGAIASNTEELKNKISLYPNPFTDVLSLNLKSIKLHIESVSLISSDGKVLKTLDYQQGNSKCDFMLPELAPGNYHIRFEGDFDPFTIAVQKQ